MADLTHDQDQALAELKRMVDLRLRLDQAIAAQVATCRRLTDRWGDTPTSWTHIAAQLRVTKQAARQKYRPHELFDELDR